jgi:hypothetical protein
MGKNALLDVSLYIVVVRNITHNFKLGLAVLFCAADIESGSCNSTTHSDVYELRARN